ncbi:hypothetical protein [Chitinimonas naiadis]
MKHKTPTRKPTVLDTRDYHVTQPVDDPLLKQQQVLQQGLLVNGVRYHYQGPGKPRAQTED